MVATQQVWENMTWGLIIRKARLGSDMQKAVVMTYALSILGNEFISSMQWPRSHHRVSQWPTHSLISPFRHNITQDITESPSQVPTNHVRVHAAHDHERGSYNSFTLYRGCTHSPWVVISSPVSRRLTSPFCHVGQAYSHFLWCKARRPLQDFSMVSSSL
jgi:hypothetical protein